MDKIKNELGLSGFLKFTDLNALAAKALYEIPDMNMSLQLELANIDDPEYMKKMKGGILTITNYYEGEEVKTPVKIFHHPVDHWTCIVIDDICTREILEQCLMFLESKDLKPLLKGFGVKHPNTYDRCVLINNLMILSIRHQRYKYKLQGIDKLKFINIKEIFKYVKSI